MFSGERDAPRVQWGHLGPCLERPDRELLCIWADQFGVGSLSMLFGTAPQGTGSGFSGNWQSGIYPLYLWGASFAHRSRVQEAEAQKYYKSIGHPWSDWGGILQ